MRGNRGGQVESTSINRQEQGMKEPYMKGVADPSWLRVMRGTAFQKPAPVGGQVEQLVMPQFH